MAKLLFTHSYFLNLDPKQEEAGNAYPPLGTLYAASYLRENGHEVSLFDSMLAESPSRIFEKLDKEAPDYLVIYDDGFDYLTKMCLTNMRDAAFSLIIQAKEKNIPVIISSSDSTDHFEKYLEKGANFVILGEGETTLFDLIGALESKAGLDSIQGIVYNQDGQTFNGGKRPVLRDLDALPFPAWDLIDFKPYRKIWLKKVGYFSLNVVSTRGCTYKCNWCAKPIFGNRYNARTPAQVVEELEYLIEFAGATHFWFCDDIFGLKPGWLQEFANLVVEKGIKFSFKIQSRADLMVDEKSVAALAKAGCDTVWIGAESGSQKILDAMEKGITIAQVYQSRELLKKYGVKTAFFLQFGYLGETRNDIDATLKMVMDLMPDDIGISVSYPLPGTKLFEIVKNQLGDKTNWKDSDEMLMMFQNTYPQPFYKELQRYMHSLYRRKKSILAVRRLLKTPQKVSLSLLRSAVMSLYHIPSSALKRRKLDTYKPL